MRHVYRPPFRLRALHPSSSARPEFMWELVSVVLSLAAEGE
jgi:hypothetical protein